MSETVMDYREGLAEVDRRGFGYVSQHVPGGFRFSLYRSNRLVARAEAETFDLAITRALAAAPADASARRA